MKRFKKIVLRALEAFMARRVHGAIAFAKTGRNVTPGGVSGEVNDYINVAAFPFVYDNMSLIRRGHRLNLYPVIVGTIGNENIRTVAVVQHGYEHLPPIVH